MTKFTDELKTKLLQARSAEEAAALVKADGQELSPEDAAQLWAEITKRREQDGRELSPDELEAVSGGVRDWITEGCAATVECGSTCWSDDRCILFYEHYKNPPISVTCPKCGTSFYRYEQRSESNPFAEIPVYYICKNCGYSEFAYYLD